MAQAKINLSINGWDNELDVHTLSIRQAYNRHHVFELMALVPVGYQISVDLLKRMLGEQASIEIATEKGEDGKCKFVGFVDEVEPIWNTRSTLLRIKGFSPTIFMDCIPRFRTFTEKTQGQILDKVISGYNLSIKSNSTGDKVSFSVQSQETDYQFLCRLADNHGKLFFYDGEKAHFGTLDDLFGNPVPLDFKRESNHLELSLNLAPLRFQLNGYELKTSELVHHNSNREFSNSNPVVQAAMDKSNCYPTQLIHLNHLINGKTELQAAAKKIAAGQAHELVTLHGTSNNPALKIGGKISIEETQEIMANGSYIVIEVHHQVGSDNAYHNSFTAVPEGYPFPIRMRRSKDPVTGPLMAIVKENADPDQLGRVKVEFIGDEEKELSPWLRVLVPYTKYGGMYFLPEKEDQVMVFYEDFNVEKSPFVMGSFFHGKATAEKWNDKDNSKKGIAMDKINFLFDDKTGKLTIEAEEVEINAKKGMALNGGHHLTQKAKRIDLNP